MIILCSGEEFKEPITDQQCLGCSLEWRTPPCGYRYSTLKAMFDTQEDDVRATEIHVSDIVHCLLKAYLDKTSPAPEFVHEKLNKWIGTSAHCAQDQSDPVLMSEVRVRLGDILGKVDRVYQTGDIEDLKTKRWLTTAHDTSEADIQQLNIYRHMLIHGQSDLPNSWREAVSGGRMFIQYIDMSGPSKCRRHKAVGRMVGGKVTFPCCDYVLETGHLGAITREIEVWPEGEAWDFVDERVSELRTALETKVPPPAEPSWLCGYCNHRSCEYNRRDKEA